MTRVRIPQAAIGQRGKTLNGERHCEALRTPQGRVAGQKRFDPGGRKSFRRVAGRPRLLMLRREDALTGEFD